MAPESVVQQYLEKHWKNSGGWHSQMHSSCNSAILFLTLSKSPKMLTS